VRRAAGIAAAFLLCGCAKYSVRDADLVRLERGELVPGQVVFTCHGMLYDLGFPWDFRLRDRLSDGTGGRLAVVISYGSDATGVWFNWGSRAPGLVLAALADEIEDLHRSSGCPASLSLRAVGFSAGCEAILEAAGRMRAARLERAVLFNSSSFAFSSEPRRLIEEGRIGRIENYWSPFDLVTLLAPLGAGQFGLRPTGEGIENRCLWNTHLPPLFSSGLERMKQALVAGPAAPGPSHTCGADERYRRALAELLRRGRGRSR